MIFPALTPLLVCRNVQQYPQARQIDGLLILCINSSIYFANVDPVRKALAKQQRRAVASLALRRIALRYIILDLSPVSDIDAAAIHWLKVGLLLSLCCPLRMADTHMTFAGLYAVVLLDLYSFFQESCTCPAFVNEHVTISAFAYMCTSSPGHHASTILRF